MKPQKPIMRQPLHPTDKALANFIENRLSTKERKKIIKHFVYCNKCCDIVAICTKYINKKY